MTTVKWIIIVYLVLNLIFALIPDLYGQVSGMTANLGNVWVRVSLRFLFVPTEYVWKWIVGLLVTVIALFVK